jgi:hypothetical protein
MDGAIRHNKKIIKRLNRKTVCRVLQVTVEMERECLDLRVLGILSY